jgi:ribosomal protein L21E
MGSFGGVKFDTQNFEQTVDLAQKKALDEQYRIAVLAQNLNDYRVNQLNSTFPDGQYYVSFDFNSQLINFQGDSYNKNKAFTGLPPVLKQFKKGEIVNVITTPTNMSGNLVKAIQTKEGNFYADQNNLSKTKPVENVNTQSLSGTKKSNSDKTIILILGAFLLGFLLSKD